MAVTQNSYTGNNSTTNYSFTFPYLNTADVKCSLDGVVTTAFTLANATTVQFNTAPSTGAKIKIYRETADDSLTATFYAGSSIKSEDLNDNFTQNLYTTQEVNARYLSKNGDGVMEGNINLGKDADIVFEGSTNNAHETTLTLVDPTQDNVITFPDITGTVITTADTGTVARTMIAADAINGTKIADDSVDSEHIVADSLDTEHYAANSVDTTALAADSVTGAQIADNAVNSEHYVDGSIDRVHLAADIVDGTKIADDSINSEHYVDGSIDHEHLAIDIVQAENIADNNITNALMADDSVGAAELIDSSVGTAALATNAVTLAKMADNSVGTAELVNDAVTAAKLANDAVISSNIVNANVTGPKIANDAVTTDKIANANVSTSKIADNAVTADKIADSVIVTNSEHSSATVNDVSFFTTSASDARYFNISSGDTIKDGQTFPDNDTTIATTAAINDRIIDLVDDIGGFVPIANETSFPTSNPDVNNGTGTLISIKALASNLTSNGSGVATIANGAGSGNTVTITGLANSTTYAATFGMIVETTGTLHTYTFHRQVPKATEVTTVAGSVSNVNTVAGAISNVNAVAGNATNINAVAGNNSNITSVAGNASNINSAVSNASNINSAVSNASNINTTAGSISNVNTVAGSISNVNSVASNMGTVNDFAARYRTGSSNPTSSLDEGDLFFNTTANELKVYNGSAWQGGVTATGNFAVVTGNTFTGDNIYNDGVKAKFGTGSDLQIYSDGSNAFIANTTGDFLIRNSASNEIKIQAVSGEQSIVANANGSVDLYYDNVKTFETKSNGVIVQGTEGQNAELLLYADEGDDNADKWRLKVDTNGQLEISNFASGSYEKNIECNGNGNVELYYDNSKKLETTSGGGTLTGDWSVTNDLFLADNGELVLGTGGDLKLYHNGSDSYIVNNTGGLHLWGGGDGTTMTIRPKQGENSIVANANGSVDLYYDNSKKLDTHSGGINVTGSVNPTGNVALVDDSKLKLGDGDDLQIFHNGTRSKIQNNTGDLRICSNAIQIKNYDDDETYITCADNGNVELYSDNIKTFTTSTNACIIWGSEGNNASLYFHADEGDDWADYWNLTATSDAIFKQQYRDDSGGFETSIKSNRNGSVELYYDNSKKLETISSGVKIHGSLVPMDGSRDLGTSSLVWQDLHIGNDIHIADSGKTIFGAGDDLQIYHDGTNNLIKSGNAGTNDLKITNTGNFVVETSDSENLIRGIKNGQADLYFDGTKKFETTSVGVKVTGNYQAVDGYHIYLGTGNDLDIYHDGSASYIRDTGTGQLRIDSNAFEVMNAADSEYMIKTAENGAVELYYDGSRKLRTTSTGIAVEDHIDMDDGHQLRLGSGSDFTLDHNGSDSTITNSTGNLRIRNAGEFQVTKSSTENMLIAAPDGAVELYYDGVKHFETNSGGAKVNDNKYVGFGNGNDLQISHDGTHSYLTNTTGELVITDTSVIRCITDDFRMYKGDGGEMMFRAQGDAGIDLRYDNSVKLESKSHGVEVTGRLSVNATSQLVNESAITATSGGNTACFRATGSINHLPLMTWNNGTSGNRSQIQFADGSSYTSRGSITTNGSNVTYGGTSDYRLKQDDVLITDGITKVKALKPKRFKWKDNLSIGICDGFFAHEVQETAPTSGATIGAKDAVDSDGNPVYQTVDQAKLVPLLTAALQEAISKIETLETKVAALESS